MKRKKGMSLIVLVLTIIIMIILAGTVIISINNNKVIDKTKVALDKNFEKNLELQIKLAYLNYQKEQFDISNLDVEDYIKSQLEDNYNEEINVEKVGKDIKLTFTESNNIYKYYSSGKIKRLIPVTQTIYSKLDEDEQILYITNINKNGYSAFNSNNYKIRYIYDVSKISKVYIEQPISITNATEFFLNCSNMTEIVNLNNIFTDNCEYMSQMFCNCSNLTKLDLSSFDTNNVDNFTSMYSGCSSLEKLNLGIKFIIKEESTTTGIFSYASKIVFKTTHAIADRLKQINTSLTDNSFDYID